ncbi:HNH endonuclease [Burkholderia diffusa]|uniref:HNH endonuclease n=1 Tax=Burkholderia diffusa TaxID=488732 RepID=UPI0009BE317D|nr:HNH endonuclease [Burkholderia diffusa]
MDFTANTITHTEIPPRPAAKRPVRELLEHAGLDVTAWAFTKDGHELENPNDNIGRNTSWSFVGEGDEPIALCLWYDDIDWSTNPARYNGNDTEYQKRLTQIAGTRKGPNGLGRLNSKLRRSRMLYQAVWDAHKKNRPIKILLVDGDPVPIEESAEKASIVKARDLDPATWYVHDIDGSSGRYTIVRGEKPIVTKEDPFEKIPDPGLDPAFQSYIKSLSETEREAAIKARVGQGPFRQGLIERWDGRCAVSDFSMTELLIASHIKPWSLCETPAERLGAANGLLLSPNLDRLFDRGFIGFSPENFKIVLSPQLKDGFARQLNVDRHMAIRKKSFDDLHPFLAWHLENLLRTD